MKLKLTEAGFEKYTGQMGVTNFVDGLSVGDVAAIDAIRISAALGAQWENGDASNVGEMYLNNMDVPAHVGGFNEMSAPVENFSPESAPQALVAQATYTAEGLAKIADEKGIAGLREIADRFGVKGTSINGLIEALMKAQAKPTAE